LNCNTRNRECKIRTLCFAIDFPLLPEYDAAVRSYRFTTFQRLNMKPVRRVEIPWTNYPVTWRHMLVQWFPGDSSVHFCNGCFEVFLFYKLKNDVFLKIIEGFLLIGDVFILYHR